MKHHSLLTIFITTWRQKNMNYHYTDFQPRNLAWKTGALLAALWLGALTGKTAEHYVRPPETCTNTIDQSPFTNWDTAATNIQWAVNVASVDETVYVTNGSYCVTNQIMITNRITLKSMNGYSNTSVYAIRANTNRCIYVARTSVVDGFTISNGFLTGSNDYSGGGGAYVTGNSTVQNCYFANNICSNAGERSGGGGVNADGYATVLNCIFVSNVSIVAAGHANSGGGGGLRIDAGARVLNCTIISNYAQGYYGGGIYCYGGSTIVSNCFIAVNYVGQSGGGVALNNIGHLLIDCVISNNRAGIEGGGVKGYPGTVRNCLIVNNVARYGGGYSEGDVSLVSNCVIVGNVANNVSGGLSGGGGIYGASLTVDCRISNNICTVGYGGGVKTGGTLRNSLICNNTNMASGGNAGGVYLLSGRAVNCTIVNNFSTNEGGGIMTTGTCYVTNCIIAGNRSSSNNYPDIYNTGSNSNGFWYSCATNVLFAPNQGNITNDPMFVDSAAGNWRLQASSPCINAGMNQSWMTNSFDLDGRIRIRYGIVDMGAYETIYNGTIFLIGR